MRLFNGVNEVGLSKYKYDFCICPEIDAPELLTTSMH